MADAVVVIPARWASSRFPGKVLASLGGRPLVTHACALAQKAARVREVCVATDDPRVRETVETHGFRAVMTRPDHASGTDRVREAAATLGGEVVIGLQADEPFLAPEDLDQLVEALGDSAGDKALATLAIPLTDERDWLDPNVVKVVCDASGRALYFSRSPLPYHRAPGATLTQPPPGPVPEGCRAHVGVYAWRREALEAFAELPPSPLERAEGLEQLRALEAGFTIHVRPAAGEPFGVDTPQDLERAETHLARTRTDRT